jgi:ATP-binding cassette subfamily B protein
MSRPTTGGRHLADLDWRYRIKALTNIPPILKMVWESAPAIVSSSLFCRFVAALVPLTMLAVTRIIIDSITGLTAHHNPLPGAFWWLVALEFGLATLTMILGRIIDFCDAVLADKFTCHINTRIMEHASSLDLL